jgi:hypothetical protein
MLLIPALCRHNWSTHMNIIDSLIVRIEDYRATNKNPCKNYGSQAAAEKAIAKTAQLAGEYFARDQSQAQSARYVVFYIEAWGRWVGAIDLTELLSRKNSTGGYLGICGNIYTY